jgi:RNA polymerase-interacting CarD/CdnL/TRCF family regulator
MGASYLKENTMSWSQWEAEVLHILNNSDDENTRMVAVATNAYTEELKAGNISQSEYAELLRDLQRQITITENMNQFETKQRLNTAITALVTIASAV